LYLTQADPHDVTLDRPALSRERLRSYLMFYGMFFDKLMVGDSQFINNIDLRSLLWPGEADVDPGLRTDLSLLLDHKVLLPAVRDDVTSLYDVWQDLTKRGVPEAGSEQYVHFVEEHLGNEGRIAYQLKAVSGFFRDQVLATFARDNPDLRLDDSVRQAVYNYVSEQDVLYYIHLRQWMKKQLELGRMEEFHRNKIDRAVAAAYRHNVPKAIKGSLIDIPLDPRKFWTPIDIRLGRAGKFHGVAPEYVSLPTRPFAVSPYVLARLPAQTLLAIRDDPTRRPVMKHFREFRNHGTVDPERLVGDIDNFLLSAEEIAFADAQGDLRDLIRRRRREHRSSNVTIVRDTGLAVAGLSVWGTVGSVAGYVGLAVTAWASLDALRHRDKTYRHGYAIGRALPQEHRLLLERPGNSPEES
jgi:hypothetical protein